MRQLQLFTTAELSRMRDRTASRNYSPERDEFRRVHEHHRAWGLVQRHGQRLRHLRNSSRAPRSATMPENRRQDHLPAPAPAPAQAPTPALAPAPALVPAPARPGQRQHATPAAVDQRRCPARSRPTRSRHLSASQEPVPCHETLTSAVEPAQPGWPLPTRAGPGPVGAPGESPHLVTPGPSRPAPEPSLPVASRGSGRHAETIRPAPRPPRHHYRQALIWPAAGMIDANSKPLIRHPAVSPQRSAKTRGPPDSRDLRLGYRRPVDAGFRSGVRRALVDSAVPADGGRRARLLRQHRPVPPPSSAARCLRLRRRPARLRRRDRAPRPTTGHRHARLR